MFIQQFIIHKRYSKSKLIPSYFQFQTLNTVVVAHLIGKGHISVCCLPVELAVW